MDWLVLGGRLVIPKAVRWSLATFCEQPRARSGRLGRHEESRDGVERRTPPDAPGFNSAVVGWRDIDEIRSLALLEQ